MYSSSDLHQDATFQIYKKIFIRENSSKSILFLFSMKYYLCFIIRNAYNLFSLQLAFADRTLLLYQQTRPACGRASSEKQNKTRSGLPSGDRVMAAAAESKVSDCGGIASDRNKAIAFALFKFLSLDPVSLPAVCISKYRR